MTNLEALKEVAALTEMVRLTRQERQFADSCIRQLETALTPPPATVIDDGIGQKLGEPEPITVSSGAQT